jgi:hypothetical protein
VIGRLLRSAADNALSNMPRRAYGRGAFGRGWRRHITERDRARAVADMERERGVYSFERDIRPTLAVALGGTVLGQTAALEYARQRNDPLREQRRAVREQRRLLEALMTELSVANSGNEAVTEHLSDDAPNFSRSTWRMRFDNFRRQHAREQRMRDIISRLNTDYVGYSGNDHPDEWDERP